VLLTYGRFTATLLAIKQIGITFRNRLRVAICDASFANDDLLLLTLAGGIDRTRAYHVRK
jgi:hypothetical protein